jgi:purine-binding chemotaxis protein CheW
MARLQQFCTFFVDDLLLAVDVRKIQEVIRYQEMTRVPTAPAMIRGLVNLRGQIVTAIDLRCRLELSPPPEDWLPMNVVIRTDDISVSLLVDTIGDVLELDEDEFEPSPETIPSVIRDVLVGMHLRRDQLLLILDPDHVVSPAGSLAFKC